MAYNLDASPGSPRKNQRKVNYNKMYLLQPTKNILKSKNGMTEHESMTFPETETYKTVTILLNRMSLLNNFHDYGKY